MKAGSGHPGSPVVDPSHDGPSAGPRPCCATPFAQSSTSPDGETPTPQAEASPHLLQILAHTPARRDATIQALRQAVEQGTYHVPAEQVAAKMLQDALHETLP